MTNRPLATLLILTLLLAVSLKAQLVGESMAFEGRAAVLRAADALRQAQAQDGTWNQDPQLTAHALCALQAATPYLQDRDMDLAVGKALAKLRQQLPHLKPQHLTLAIRPLLMAQDEADQPLLKQAQQRLLAHAQHQTLSSPWTADTALLTAQRLKRPIPPHLLHQLTNHPPASPAQQLALAIINGTTSQDLLKNLAAQTRKRSFLTLPMEELIWTARTLRTCNRTKLIPYDGWKADMMSALLDRQRGNGTWATKIPDFFTKPSPEDLRNTALAIQAAILCLMD